MRAKNEMGLGEMVDRFTAGLAHGDTLVTNEQKIEASYRLLEYLLTELWSLLEKQKSLASEDQEHERLGVASEIFMLCDRVVQVGDAIRRNEDALLSIKHQEEHDKIAQEVLKILPTPVRV